MKRLVCLSVVVAVMIGVFSLGQMAFAAEKIRINYWSLMSASDKEVMDLMIEEFNKAHSDIEVYSSVASFDNYYQQLTAAMASGKAPDVAIMHTRSIPAYDSEKLMYTLDDVLETYGFKAEDYIGIAWEGGVVNGKRWTIPLDVIIALVNFYNKDIFEKAGITAPPQMGQELIDVAAKIKEATGVWGLDIPLTADPIRLYRYWFSALRQQGGRLLNDDETQAAFNTPEGVKALQFWIDLIYTKQVAAGSDMGLEGFQFGKVGMMLHGIWNSNAFNNTEGLNWDIGPMPSLFDNSNHAFFSNSHNWAFPKNKDTSPEKFDAALKFVKWMSENSLPWGKVARMVPARRSVIESEEYKALPWAAPLLAQVEDAAFPPQIKETAQMQDAIIKYLQMAITGEISAEEAMANAEKEVNKILK
jgi:multiple sugar transport system substrate-binding protein